MNKKLSVVACVSIFLLTTPLLGFSEMSKGVKTKELVGHKKFTMCAAIRMKEINLNHLAKDPEKYTTAVPEGWTVVSGTGGEGHPKLLVCR